MGRRTDRNARPGLESLEAREVMTISTPSVARNVLTIVGNGANDVVSVSKDNYNGNLIVTDHTNGRWWRFNQYGVGRVEFRGNAGDDAFKNYTVAPTRAFGGAGNDYLEGGRGDDLLDGGDGGDTLVGDEGDDALYGGYGRDALVGGYGKDYLNGGYDDDSMEDWAWEYTTFYDAWGTNTSRRRWS